MFLAHGPLQGALCQTARQASAEVQLQIASPASVHGLHIYLR